jgi:transcriptional regulator with XRE-family HTH domain
MGTEGQPSAGDITKAVGLELRNTRLSLGLTLAQLVDRMPSGIRVPTLAGYETGTRSFTVGRLVEICVAMGVSAPNLLAAAVRRAGMDPRRAGAVVDLRALAQDRQASLAPLRRWALRLLDDDVDGDGVAIVEPSLVLDMARFCGLSPEAMGQVLDQFTLDEPGPM